MMQGKSVMIRLILTTLAFTAISSLAVAQQPAETGARAAIYEAIASVTENPAPPISDFIASQAAGQLLASDFIGRRIHDPKGLATGTIEDVLFDESGKLSVVVLDVSELIGSPKRIAINLADIRRTEDGSELVAALDRGKIEEAPAFTSLSQEMQSNDGQSLTEDEVTGSSEPANKKSP